MLATIYLVCCSSSAKEGQKSEYPTFIIKGRIDNKLYQNISIFLKQHKNERVVIQITSPGGNSLDAMAIGNEMFKGDVKLEILSICHSACAQYIMPSAQSVEIMKGSTVAFHSSPSDLQPPRTASDAAKLELARFKSLENEFYKQRGIDPETIKKIRKSLLPICTVEVSNKSPIVLNRYGIYYKYAVAVPSIDLLRRAGFKDITGYWPNDKYDAELDARIAGFNKKLTIRFVQTTDLENLVIDNSLPKCRN